MGKPRFPDPQFLVIAVFSRHAEVLTWAREQLERCFGPVVLTSAPFEFNQTAYYESSMGTGLRKQFLVFQDMVAAETLPDIKRQTNALEERLATTQRYPEQRPVNLDPGLLSLGKFQLATTKDQAHRIYLRDGVFAEVTLRFQAGTFVPWPWTYADYRQPSVLEFLTQAREEYRQRLQRKA